MSTSGTSLEALWQIAKRINYYLDQGRVISMEQARDAAREKRVCAFLSQHSNGGLPGAVTVNLTESDHGVIGDFFESFAQLPVPHEYEIRNNGLCLWLSWTMELISHLTDHAGDMPIGPAELKPRY